MTVPLLGLHDVTVSYEERRGTSRSTTALDRVSLAVQEGAALGIVGESGSGKSTLARVMLGLEVPASGRVTWRGAAIEPRDRRRMLPVRGELQAVFQDPFGSLDPRMTAGTSVAEALEVPGDHVDPSTITPRVERALHDVGLDASYASRYPHELSGGQCQRVAIARAMIRRPRLLICDEAVSALDVSVQAQIVNLLRDLRERTGMALVFISHNIAVVRVLCDAIVVLRRGRIVETGPTQSVLDEPVDPYTRALIAAVPKLSRAVAIRAPSEVSTPGE